MSVVVLVALVVVLVVLPEPQCPARTRMTIQQNPHHLCSPGRTVRDRRIFGRRTCMKKEPTATPVFLFAPLSSGLHLVFRLARFTYLASSGGEEEKHVSSFRLAQRENQSFLHL